MDPRVEQAQRLLAEGKEYEARVLLQTVIDVDPQNTDALFLCVYFTKTSQQAETLLRQILDINPQHTDAQEALNKLAHRRFGGAVSSAQAEEGRKRIEMIALLMVLALAVVIVIAAVLIRNADTEDAIPSAAQSEVIASPTLLPTRVLHNVASRPTDLPSTWTPSPSPTFAPTNTLAPTMTPRPTNTTQATFTPTPVEVAAIRPSIANFGRVYVVYTELAAQSSWLDDAAALRQVQNGFQALIESFEISDYSSARLSAEEADFVNGFVLLLHYSYELALAREELVSLEKRCVSFPESDSCGNPLTDLQADVEVARVQWLQQDEIVGSRLSAIRRQATSNAVFNTVFGDAMSPASTVIFVETMPPFMPTVIPDGS